MKESIMKQSAKEFFSSKVNWVGMVASGALTYLFMGGMMTWQEYTSAIGPFLVAMGLRDTMFR